MKHLYETFCSVCHGAQAKGKGTISDVYPQAADLTTEMYKEKMVSSFIEYQRVEYHEGLRSCD